MERAGTQFQHGSVKTLLSWPCTQSALSDLLATIVEYPDQTLEINAFAEDNGAVFYYVVVQFFVSK